MVRTRIIHKRDKRKARNAGLLCMAASFLVLADPDADPDLAFAAFASGLMAMLASRRALLAEFRFRKYQLA